MRNLFKGGNYMRKYGTHIFVRYSDFFNNNMYANAPSENISTHCVHHIFVTHAYTVRLFATNMSSIGKNSNFSTILMKNSTNLDLFCSANS